MGKYFEKVAITTELGLQAMLDNVSRRSQHLDVALRASTNALAIYRSGQAIRRAEELASHLSEASESYNNSANLSRKLRRFYEFVPEMATTKNVKYINTLERDLLSPKHTKYKDHEQELKKFKELHDDIKDELRNN